MSTYHVNNVATAVDSGATPGREESQSLATPDVTLTEFVLGHAHARGERRALVDAVSGKVLSYRELGRAGREVAAGCGRAASALAMWWRCARRTASSSPRRGLRDLTEPTSSPSHLQRSRAFLRRDPGH
jgi:hypothetical protein